MATKDTGWLCFHNASLISQNDTTATIRVEAVWKNNGWTYNVRGASAWVTCNGETVQVSSNVLINTTSSTTASQNIGYHDFVVSKGHSSAKIKCTASISMSSSYVSGTKGSGELWVDIGAKTAYTVSYNSNQGTGGPGAQTKWYNENLTLSSIKPSRTGYSFVRWNMNTANTGNAYSPGQIYSANTNVTLYAIWTPNTYTVTYDANSGTGAPSNQTKIYGTDLTLTSIIPTKTNYNFLGWSTTNNGGVIYNSGTVYTDNTNVTLYAVWELAYLQPRISNLSIQRCDYLGMLIEDGSYVKVSFDWETDKSITNSVIYWKLQNDITWTNNYIINSTGTSGSVEQIIGSGSISIDNTYNVRVYLSDDTGETYSATLTISTKYFPIDVKNGGVGVAIGKASEKEAMEIAMDVYDKYDQLIGNGLSEYGDGNIDANTTLSSLCLSEINTPNNVLYHIFTIFYNDKTITSRRTQLAIPYIYNITQNRRNVYIRQYTNNEWNDWTCISNEHYYVGSIYISSDSTSPASLYGGTWEQIKGRYLFATSNETGTPGISTYTGANTQSTTLTVNQIPSHTHNLSRSGAWGQTATHTGMLYEHGANLFENLVAQATGGGQGHTHNVSYYGIYVWRKVS